MGGIFYRDESGHEHCIKEVEGISGSGCIVVQTSMFMRDDDLCKIEEQLSKRFGKRVVAVDRRIEKIFQINK
mgnify:CR=1 FL=1